MNVTTNPERRAQAVAEITAWQQHVWDIMEEGRLETLQPDPFYERNSLLTPEVIEKVLHTVEFDILEYEIQHYPGYHYPHQGLVDGEKLVRPGFTELPDPQKLAMVQGMDRILQQYRV